MELTRNVMRQGPCIERIAKRMAGEDVQRHLIPTDVGLKGRK